MNEAFKSNGDVADCVSVADVAHLTCAAVLTERQERNLSHVLACHSCLESFAHTLGGCPMCALIQPQLDAFVHGTLQSKVLRRHMSAHIKTCAVCREDLRFARQRKEIEDLPDPGVRAAVRLGLALVDAALDDQHLARLLLLAWLGVAHHRTRLIARKAAKLAHIQAAARAHDSLTVRPLVAEAAVRHDVLRFLAQQADLLDDLGLRIDCAGTLRESTSVETRISTMVIPSFEPHPGTAYVPGWRGVETARQVGWRFVGAITSRCARVVAEVCRYTGTVLLSGLQAELMLYRSGRQVPQVCPVLVRSWGEPFAQGQLMETGVAPYTRELYEGEPLSKGQRRMPAGRDHC